MRRIPLIALLLVAPLLAQTGQSDQQWSLDHSTLTYHMSHPIHEVDGVSHAARGKGVCHAGECDFLVAAPVKSFDSGDSNRDLHMLQTTRGAEFPVVSVRFRLPQTDLQQPTVKCDLEVQFAGNTAHYANVAFQQTISGATHRITGTIPATLTDFKITPPTFLTVPIKNEIPVRVDMTWHP
ncbi:MAG TPA: YceI family protein [Acidobacteriaceae bacterium]